MISIHDIKDGLIIFGLVIYLGWGLFKRVREDFRKEFLELVRRGINTGMTEEELMTLVQKGYEEEQR